MADIVVLAEDAPQVAPSEKDGAAAMPPDQGELLAEVGPEAGNHGELSDPADTFFTLQTIDVTMPGTEGTVPENCMNSIDPPGQLPRFMKTNIGWQCLHGALPLQLPRCVMSPLDRDSFRGMPPAVTSLSRQHPTPFPSSEP